MAGPHRLPRVLGGLEVEIVRRRGASRPRARLAVLLSTPALLAALACGERQAPAEAPAATVVRPCTEVSVDCGAAPSVRFDARGRLWVAFEQQGHVWVVASDDLGTHFATPVRVHPEPETIETNGENRPKIAFGPPGTLYVSWTKKVAGGFNGEIRFSRSLDGGLSFEPARAVNDDGLVTGHRFESLHVDGAGDLYLAWIDKRDLEAARARGEEYRGAAVYSTVSTDRGATFAANRRVADHACECCRIGVTDAGERGAALLWRQVFEGEIRDHAFATIGVEGISGEPRRASFDGWHLEGCPHHGPALLPAGGGRFHLAWFTGAKERPVVLYGRFDSVSGALDRQAELAAAASAHPDIGRAGERLLVVWKESEGEATVVYLRSSDDEGATWSERRRLASTRGASDHPFVATRGADAFLAWHTAAEGLRIVPAGG